jgi:hypothetical protein
MLLTAYAIDKASPAHLQPDLLEIYYGLSTIWQNWNQQYRCENLLCSRAEAHSGTTAEPKSRKRPCEPDDLVRHFKKVKKGVSSSGSERNGKSLSEGQP